MLAPVDEAHLVLVKRVQEQLHADEREDKGDAVLEVHQLVDEVAEQEVQLPEPHQGEDVRGEDDEWALGDSEDGGNRVESEDDVGGTECDEHDEDWRENLLAVDDRANLGAVVVVGDGDALTEEADELVLGLLVLRVIGHRLIDGRIEEEQPEDVENPAEVLNELRAEQDEDATEDEREDDAHHQHLLLVFPRYREPRHDDDEHEQVVDRQAVLSEPAGDELPGSLATADDQHEHGENQGQHDVETHPQRRFLRRRDVGTPVRQHQVGDDDHGENDERADLERERENKIHGSPFAG